MPTFGWLVMFTPICHRQIAWGIRQFIIETSMLYSQLDDRSHGVYCDFCATVHLQTVCGKILTEHCIMAVRVLHGW